MGRAERIVGRREKAAAEARLARDRNRARELRRARESEWEEISQVTPAAQRSLERRDWPGASMVRLERKGLFGYRKYEKAAVRLFLYPQEWKDTTVEVSVYLLSDGRIAMDAAIGPVTPINEVLDMVLDRIGWWRSLPLDRVAESLRQIAEDDGA